MYWGNDIGSVRIRSDKDNIWFVRNVSVVFCYVVSILFVFWKNEIEVRGVIDGVKDRKNGVVGIIKDLFYVVMKYYFLEDLVIGEIDKFNDNFSI